MPKEGGLVRQRPLVGCAIICLLLVGSFCAAQEQPSSSVTLALRRFLQKKFPDDKMLQMLQFRATGVDLRDDRGHEYIVYLTGKNLCGSGGCSMLILAPNHHGFTVVDRTTITHVPIRLLPTKTLGWRDLGVFIAGGGIAPGYIARLRFNGRSYPGNPSIAPAVPLRGQVAGQIILSEASPALHVYP
jgi:hypothetical protein